MKTRIIVAAELTAPLEAYFDKEHEVDFDMMADALQELSDMYRRKKIINEIKNKKATS